MIFNRVWFEDPQGQRRHIDTERDVLDIKETGLYLDEDWQDVWNGRPWTHWIPPTKIVVITKLSHAKP